MGCFVSKGPLTFSPFAFLVAAPAFIRQVLLEIGKIVWPSRKDVLLTTIVVFAITFVFSVFFFVADQFLMFAVRGVLGIGDV